MLGKLDRSKGNVMRHTDCYEITATKLNRIAALSRANPEMVFSNLAHHFNVESLAACFRELDGQKAVGIDGIDKASYGKNLEENLQDLVGRIRRMAYIPGNVRQVQIPKEGKKGSARPLGISNFEDKLVQKMMQKILESIYEPLLHPNSYGFRPGRSCHDAIKELHAHLSTKEIETVIDVDLANYFGSISHQVAVDIISKKIGDPRIIRYLVRMFKSGILADGELTVSDEGVVQGSCCSPVIANIVADEVICKWFEGTVKRHCAGEVKLIMYADDVVICCQYHNDAVRIKKALGLRLQKFGLKMNEDKTKLVKFSKRKQRNGIDQETFDFLGFTFYIGKSRKGIYLIKVKTIGKRMKVKLKNVNNWARGIRNKCSLKQIMKEAASKLRGHIQYYGVSHNFREVSVFAHNVQRIMFRWLNRRSQRKSFDWGNFQLFLNNINFPKAKICHKLF
jgi:group II intron reverse transcriptase/maturase